MVALHWFSPSTPLLLLLLLLLLFAITWSVSGALKRTCCRALQV